MDGLLSVKECVEKYISGCDSKAKTSVIKLLFKALLAGFMIALGAVASNVAAHNIANVGIARLVAGCVFPVGLMMVVLLGAELFTGDCLAALSVFDKKQSVKFLLKLLIVVYIGNFLGALLLAFMTAFCGQFDYSGGLLGAYTIKVAVGKLNLSFLEGTLSGILCNFLVCGAVMMATCAKDVTGKLLSCFFAIMLFVTSGFEHCVANMYYIPAGIIAKMNPDYVLTAYEKFSISSEAISNLNITNMLSQNLLPVTLGNIIGGILFVAVPLYYLNCYKNN